MKKFIFFFSLFVLTNIPPARAQALGPHRWRERVLLLFAPGPGDPALNAQMALLEAAAAGMRERDLVLYRVFPAGGRRPDGAALAAGEAGALRRTYSVGDGFTLLLIGKDGGEKLRAGEPVPPAGLFGLIDAMPMRRAEMRRGNE